jgi:ribosomal protein S21
MTVYVDDMRAPYGRMIMCHMIADTEAELHAMADRVGVARRWHHRGHYNICLERRARAVAAGAHEITKRQAAAMMAQRRAGGRLPPPACAELLFRLAKRARRAQEGEAA